MVDESMLTLFHAEEIIESTREGATAGAESGVVFGPVGAGVGAGWGATLGYLNGISEAMGEGELLQLAPLAPTGEMDGTEWLSGMAELDPMVMMNPLLAGTDTGE